MELLVFKLYVDSPNRNGDQVFDVLTKNIEISILLSGELWTQKFA